MSACPTEFSSMPKLSTWRPKAPFGTRGGSPVVPLAPRHGYVPGKSTDTGIHARWFDLTGGEPRLDVLPAGSDATKAVLEAIARLRRDGEIVTVVLPEQFSKRSLMAAAQRAQFRLKSAPARRARCRRRRRPGRHLRAAARRTRARAPRGACSRRAARRRDEAGASPTLGASVSTTCVRGGALRRALLGASPSSASRSTTSPRTASLGHAMLAYARRLTDDPTVSVNVVLPERIDTTLHRLRGRRALAIKRLPPVRAARDPEQRPAPQLSSRRCHGVGQSHGLERVLGAPALFATAYGTSARRSTTRSA